MYGIFRLLFGLFWSFSMPLLIISMFQANSHLITWTHQQPISYWIHILSFPLFNSICPCPSLFNRSYRIRMFRLAYDVKLILTSFLGTCSCPLLIYTVYICLNSCFRFIGFLTFHAVVSSVVFATIDRSTYDIITEKLLCQRDFFFLFSSVRLSLPVQRNDLL